MFSPTLLWLSLLEGQRFTMKTTPKGEKGSLREAEAKVVNVKRKIGLCAVAGLLAAGMLSGCMPGNYPSTAQLAGQLAAQQEEPWEEETGTAAPREMGQGLSLGLANPEGQDALLLTASQDRVIYSVSPSQAYTVNAEGGAELEVEAYVKDGAVVQVKLGEQIVKMTAGGKTNGAYRLYEGTLEIPEAEDYSVELGNLRVYAQWQDSRKAMNGASVTVKGTLEEDEPDWDDEEESDGEDDEDDDFSLVGKDGRRVAARVTSDFAEVFPSSPVNDDSFPTCYPLPEGTVDYLASKKLKFENDTKTFYYYRLASGKRVYADDVKLFYTEDFEDNSISSVKVNSSEEYTELRFKTGWKVPFSCKLSPLSLSKEGAVGNFWPTTFSITFDYTDSVPGSVPSLSGSPLFSKGVWKEGSESSTLELTLRQKGVFFGVSSYYDGNDLVFRFPNPPVIEEEDNVYGHSLEGVRIFLDPGHDAKDPGAISYGGKVYESTLNWALAKRVKSELEALGAEVEMVDTTVGSVPMKERVAAAREFGPHIYVALHHNYSESSSKTSGVEAYYFNPYSMELAYRITKRVGSYYNNKVYPDDGNVHNRGAKFGYMYVTRYMDFPAVLVECGYISNPTELTLLQKASTQKNLARYITAGIVDYFESNSAEFAGSGKVGSSSSSGGTGKKLTLK